MVKMLTKIFRLVAEQRKFPVPVNVRGLFVFGEGNHNVARIIHFRLQKILVPLTYINLYLWHLNYIGTEQKSLSRKANQNIEGHSVRETGVQLDM